MVTSLQALSHYSAIALSTLTMYHSQMAAMLHSGADTALYHEYIYLIGIYTKNSCLPSRTHEKQIPYKLYTECAIEITKMAHLRLKAPELINHKASFYSQLHKKGILFHSHQWHSVPSKDRRYTFRALILLFQQGDLRLTLTLQTQNVGLSWVFSPQSHRTTGANIKAALQ